MTTNIGLVTSDAVVLGCDSIASASNWFIDPFRLEWTKDADGKTVKDADGKYSLKFDFSNLESVVTNSWGGVTKMFLIHPTPSPLVAITTGIAKLNDRPIGSLAGEFLAQMEAREKKKFVKCEVICKRFL